ncbi:MAG: hypothetical protein RLP02_06160 [Coleofasciculus sp. C2-GNP5-27]
MRKLPWDTWDFFDQFPQAAVAISPTEDEWLSISQLQNTLKDAIRKGLQLAIFNSCDGLGLANELH